MGDKINVLSLFDGMACGMLAMMGAGVEVENYYAYEIDKYAIKTAQHNFPQIKELGDVFEADFTQYKGIDFLVGGSPCTFWSIAQSPDKRETTASGLGWELFSQYVRALYEAQPKYFIYENNKSMAKAIYNSISETFGFEPIMINSALVSAQNRQRYYWVGKRNEDGTYNKVNILQPVDRGILLRDILDGADLTSNDKSYTLTASYNGAVAWNTIERSQRNMIVEPVRIPDTNTPDKARTLNAHYSNNAGTGEGSLENRLFNPNPCKQQVDLIAEPVNVTKDNKSHTIKVQYSRNTIANFVSNKGFDASGVVEKVGIYPTNDGHRVNSQGMRVYSINGKSVTQTAQSGGKGSYTGLYAIPIEFDNQDIPIKAISLTDGKTYTVYRVKDKTIEIKGKSYPIKLADGYYIIRKLTVNECKRLQTVPEWYEFPVSDTQAYKCLGNGWTVEVIIHLIKSILAEMDGDSE